MAKAVKKPIEIEVEQFDGASKNAKIEVERGQVTRGRVFKVWNNLHNSWIEVKIGDWLNITNPGDVYPIDAEYFKNNYNLV